MKGGKTLNKIVKKYWMYLMAAAFAAAIFINNIDSSSFTIVRSSIASAPAAEAVYDIDYSAEDIGINQEGKININTASVSELTRLPGIAEGLSKRIIEYRVQYGNFEVIQDIMKVSGIGEKKFAAIKEYIAVE